jgi:hypothetical protein
MNYERLLNISSNIEHLLDELEDEIPHELVNETTQKIWDLIQAWGELDSDICKNIGGNYQYTKGA